MRPLHPRLARPRANIAVTTVALAALLHEPAWAAETSLEQAAPNAPVPSTWMNDVDQWFGMYFVRPIDGMLFYDFGTSVWLGVSVPFVVVWLFVGAVFLTFRMGFINFRAMGHAVRVTKGDFDEENDEGEVSHFQALSSALSATVGLGNIGGVAVAVGLGGPGAVFWMVVAGLFGMTSKFVECSLGQMYREVDDEGHILGGPMRYLQQGFQEIGAGALGVVLAIVFAVLCIGASFGGGCAYQVSQSLLVLESAVADALSVERVQVEPYRWLYGVAMAGMVSIVILGGIRRIALAAEAIVPVMCLVYVIISLVILTINADRLLWAVNEIITGAFAPNSVYGGAVAAAVQGIRRASFSNEAGVGSAAIAHSAAKTKYPVREGIVALLEPFIDTVVICTISGLVIVTTGVYSDPAHATIVAAKEGAQLTSLAFASAVWWFPYILALSVLLFAYSTMISWSYYGERCATYLFGTWISTPYRLLFLAFVILGSIVKAGNLLEFSDLMLLSMAFPNILGLVMLSGKVRFQLGEYWRQFGAKR